MNITNSKFFGVRINLLWKSMEKRKEVNPLLYYFIKWRGKARFIQDEEE